MAQVDVVVREVVVTVVIVTETSREEILERIFDERARETGGEGFSTMERDGSTILWIIKAKGNLRTVDLCHQAY